MHKTITCSRHATVRMAQRGISLDDVKYVLQYGRRLWVNGAQARFLGWRDIPKTDTAKYCHLEGTLVLLDRTGNAVITTYRNRQALRLIRRNNRK